MAKTELSGVIRKRIGTRTYFFGTITSDIAKAVTFVPVIEHSKKTYLVEETEEGYQRPGSDQRMRKFRDFLNKHPDSLVPPVLLSGRGRWVFVPSEGNPEIGSIAINGPAAVIDGQHRLGGYVVHYEQTEEPRNIDFLLFEDLEREQEIEEFVTVNDTQKGVPKSLGAFLKGIELDADEDVVVAWMLNERVDSPFHGRIAKVQMGRHDLFNLASVAKQVKRTFDSGAFRELLDAETKANLMIQYWDIIGETHPDAWADIEAEKRGDMTHKLLELTGLIGYSMVAPQIIGNAFDPDSNTVNWDRVRSILAFVGSEIDLAKGGTYEGRTGEVGGKAIKDGIEYALAEYSSRSQE